MDRSDTFQLAKKSDVKEWPYFRRRLTAISNSFRKTIVSQKIRGMQLDAEQFEGSRVLIVGPARTLEDDVSEIDVDSFDYIVKMNNGLDTPLPKDTKAPMRCDILFHSFTEDARPVTVDKLSAAGVKIIVHRTEYRRDYLNTAAARSFLQERASAVVKHIPHNRYDELSAEIAGKSPTTGLMCIDFFCKTTVKELGIVGFSFYKTNYISGYDARHTSDQVSRELVSASEHDPDLEAAYVKRCISDARIKGLHVALGRNVERYLKEIG